ncbi:Asp-tRNA(Asn)/Glu-tRNA(Gln) amidotransferase subunit GatC [Candidatus Nomurabacteria bacterium]|nr:Asp-tRNA(Asn)/Glu-tRNA(Gln) amidotransferase subunit GatC [Candidatus Nomurabacteria bacterium]USN94487.1 MAG: Asp-tRNA(Asn)/Glu-tRNA(Gln) amidotransferase subunit GatC [Candidatus Nomurabacteria bacterium]
MDKEKVKYLADLARIQLSPDEVESIAKDLGQVLSYVDQIQEVDLSGLKKEFPMTNIRREDTDPRPKGEYTEGILREAPESESGYFVVKKVL